MQHVIRSGASAQGRVSRVSSLENGSAFPESSVKVPKTFYKHLKTSYAK